jgi:hypothetical protein
METPTFGAIPMCNPGGDLCAGGAFELQDAARESELVEVDGWQVQVTAGDRFGFARGGPQGNYEDALAASLLHCQKGLDLMSAQGGNTLVIKASDDDHLVWWSDASGMTIRMVSLAPVTIDVPPASLTVTNTAGHALPTPATKPLAWHESFRYFRLSQATDDLFDAYRNAYLALESILSSIAPQQINAAGRVTEREGDWFKRALMEVDKVAPLISVVPSGTSDPVQYLFDELYVNMRSAMSHAKSGRPVLLPQDESERRAIVDSLKRLVGLFLKLADTHLGLRRPGGAMFAGAFRMMFGPALDRMTMYVSDDESPFDASDSAPNPAGGVMRELAMAAHVESPRPFVVTKLWAARSEDLTDLPFIRRAVAVHKGAPTMAAVLEGRLALGSARVLEVMLGIRGYNTRQPRERYSF